MSSFLLEIVTPERKVFTEEVEMVIVSGQEGEMGIMANHVPLVTPLKIAPLRIKRGGNTESIAVNGGFMEVRKNKVVILAESAELPQDIDVDRAKSSKERAEDRIKGSGRKDDSDFNRAELSLKRAMNRLNVAGR